jgi:hypothetical protein
MKFDVIIGNPPYNPPSSVDRGGNGSANKIWHLFVEHAFKILNKNGTLSFVTPTGWRCGSSNLKRQHRFAQDKMFSIGVAHWANARAPIDHFPTVGHSIGIDYWQINNGAAASLTIPKILLEERILPRTMQAKDITRLERWMLACVAPEDSFQLTIGGNDRRKFSCVQKSVVGDGARKWKHLNTGGNTRKGLFDWYDSKTKGFNVPKVIVHDSSGPEPFIDLNGAYGCGTHSSAYQISNISDATEIFDFFKSDLCAWIVNQFSEEGALGYPTNLFKTIPKKWRSI